MATIVDLSSGKISYTYPPEIQEEIQLYQIPGYEELYSAFKILETVYNYEKGYKVAIRPCRVWGNGGNIVWRYRITSPLLNQRIYIKESAKTGQVMHEHITEYQLNIGKLFEMSTRSGPMTYMCELITGPAKQKFLAEPGRYQAMEKRRRSNLINMANEITGMQH